ncbi:dynamin family protein [Xylaria sp. FL0043]|nr:dynamin family protein [Xylaria sp. FL0043]
MPPQSVDSAISGSGHGIDESSAARGGAPGFWGEPLRLQELGNKQRELLDVISSLRDVRFLNIELPQIVVVGEQSAGKSSALEAITGIPFLKNVGACTRYPTEIRLRKADAESYRVGIIPDKNRPAATRTRLENFGTQFNRNTPFKELFDAASAEISLGNRDFITHDTLVIDLNGKDKPHLTLVDLPGLVRNPNNEQSAKDIAEIIALTDEYMKNPRTLILAVIGGNSDYVQADILDKVRRFDRTGDRTIGVLTKPDAAISQGLHGKLLDLVSNRDEENKIKLGWHVLLNPGQNEQWTNREKEEDTFFMNPPWNTLPKEMTRAKALATKLSEQLARHIASYIPKLKEQVRQELDTCEKAQKALGEGLGDNNEMRQNLTALLNKSAQVTRDAAYGNYINDSEALFFVSDGNSDNPPHEYLRARVVLANEQFAEDLRTKGHSLGLTRDSSDVETQLKGTELKRKKKEYAATNVARMIEHNRGSHLDGDTSHHVPYLLVSNHSSGWKALADNHLEEIDSICQGFVDKVLAKLWPSPMHDPLRRHLLNAGMEACKREASEQVQKLAEDLAAEVQAYSPLYKKRLDSWCAKHHSPAGNTDEHPESLNYTVPELVLEKSLILYDIIAGTFLRNVIVQAVERGFMRGLPTIFASEKVVAPDMSDETVRQIAGDDPQTRKKRLQLKEQAKELREAYAKINNLRGKFENPTAFDKGIADNSNNVSGDQSNKGGDPGSRSSTGTVPPPTPESPDAPLSDPAEG